MKIANKLFLTVLSFFSMIIGADGLNSFAKKPVIEVKAKENMLDGATVYQRMYEDNFVDGVNVVWNTSDLCRNDTVRK